MASNHPPSTIHHPVRAWFNERLPLVPVLRWALEEDIPGGAGYAYVFGSANVILFLLLAVTGVLQLFYYVPTVDHAYESVMYLRTQVAFGWLVHGLHYWAAQAFVVMVGLHLAQVFVWGAYKNPRQMTWLTGVVLLLVTAALAFTGPLLAWDQLGYWAAEVGTSIMGTVPWIGDFLQRFVRGGETMGQQALSRFFIFHVAILPAVLVALIVLHLAAFRQFGGAGSWDPEKGRRVGKFWPDQVYQDALFSALVVVILIGLCVYWPAPVTGPADPLGRSITPKPSWNFLFLYQTLKSFRGPWEVVGTVGVPLLLVLLLLLLPFYDRRPERNPRRRPFALVAGAALALLILGLTVLGQLAQPLVPGGPKTEGAHQTTDSTAVVHPPVSVLRRSSAILRPQVAWAALGQTPQEAGGSGGSASVRVLKGQQLYQATGCAACHKINGQGGAVGPDLSQEASKGRSAAWLATQLRDPKANNAASLMPPYPSLSQDQRDSLIAYLLSLGGKAAPPAAAPEKPVPPSVPPAGPTQPLPPRTPAPGAAKPAPPSTAAPGPGKQAGPSVSVPGPAQPPAAAGQKGPPSPTSGPPGEAARMVGGAKLGRTLFADYCSSCHGPQGTDQVPNPGSQEGSVPALNPIDPNLAGPDPALFAARLDPTIQHGSVPHGPHPAISMPAYGDGKTLTQPQIAAIEAYILALNGVDRAKIMHPGLAPERFFLVTLAAFGLLCLVAVLQFLTRKGGAKPA